MNFFLVVVLSLSLALALSLALSPAPALPLLSRAPPSSSYANARTRTHATVKIYGFCMLGFFFVSVFLIHVNFLFKLRSLSKEQPFSNLEQQRLPKKTI